MNTLKIFFAFAILFCSFSVLSVSAESWKRAFATILEERDVNVTKRDTGAQITFYQGNDLLNSACYGRNGLPSYNAKPTDMIAAMWMDDMEMCYKCLQIKNGHKTIVVKCIDKCAGCPPGGNNVDLTISAFKKLADPNLGRVAIKWRGLLKCPANGKWPEFEEKKH